MKVLNREEFDRFANDPEMLREQGGSGAPLDNSWFFDFGLNVALEHDGACLAAIYFPGGFDVHFLCPPDCRGKRGVAALRTMLQELFTTHGADRITGVIPRWNRAARAVIRLLGFAPVAETTLGGMPAVSYELDRATCLGWQPAA